MFVTLIMGFHRVLDEFICTKCFEKKKGNLWFTKSLLQWELRAPQLSVCLETYSFKVLYSCEECTFVSVLSDNTSFSIKTTSLYYAKLCQLLDLCCVAHEQVAPLIVLVTLFI